MLPHRDTSCKSNLLPWSLYTDTRPASFSSDPVKSGIWSCCHQSTSLWVICKTRPRTEPHIPWPWGCRLVTGHLGPLLPPPPPQHSFLFFNQRCCYNMLVAYYPSNMPVCLRNGSALTIVCAATRRQKLQIKLAISPSHSTWTPSQLVLALSQKRQVPGTVATRVTSMTQPGKSPTGKQSSIPGMLFSQRAPYHQVIEAFTQNCPESAGPLPVILNRLGVLLIRCQSWEQKTQDANHLQSSHTSDLKSWYSSCCPDRCLEFTGSELGPTGQVYCHWVR